MVDSKTNSVVPLRGCAAPLSEEARILCRRTAEDYAERNALVPPLSLEELDKHTHAALEEAGLSVMHRDFLMVLLGNAVWRDTMATIPFDRRILLLPQCLRDSTACPAELDEFGLLCQECGRCPIGSLQRDAEELGYVVLVAEGTSVVVKLLEQGRVDAVVGVGCLSALERSFPHTTAHAIPGLAFPLFVDGCTDTQVDVSWVRDAIHLASPEGWRPRLDIDALQEELHTWFSREALAAAFAPETSAGDLALEWMAKAGKRWRPLLAACVYQALTDAPIDALPQHVRQLTIAVECFHKASLIHDDIEDEDDARYEEATMHHQHGIPIALNVGDLLLGEGYRLLAECDLSAEQSVRAIRVAAEAHRRLCLGQGLELAGMREQRIMPSSEVLRVFRWKTSPAFEVALQLGAIAAGAEEEVFSVLTDFSDALGVAYQIQDDLDDLNEDADAALPRPIEPSLLYALAKEQDSSMDATKEKAELLLEHYKNEAIRALNPLKHAGLKTLLRRLASRIIKDR
jgi:geranylgeranyl diphosphate synthase, type II